MKNPLVFPTVHMNGTSKQTLLADYSAAHRAVQEAISSMSKIEFHSRDYYIQGMDSWDQAVAQRREMYGKLEEVKAFLLDHLVSISKQ